MNKNFLLALLLTGLLSLGCIQQGKGKVTDTIANVETQGVVWKTTEVYLTNDHDAFYCILPSDTVNRELAERFAENKTKVRIEYDIYLATTPDQCGEGSTKYSAAGVVTKIESVN